MHLGFPVSARAELYADWSWTSSEASMETLFMTPLDPALEAVLGQANLDFTDVRYYSDIDVERSDLSLGARFTLANGMLFDVGWTYVDYQDDAPILEDQSGSFSVVHGSVGWRF